MCTELCEYKVVVLAGLPECVLGALHLPAGRLDRLRQPARLVQVARRDEGCVPRSHRPGGPAGNGRGT